MEENFDALEVIAQTRGKVDMDSVPAGAGLFPLWGWLTALFYSVEFVLWQLLHQDWCLWLWIGIPLVGVPAMVMILRKDHERTHMRTHQSKLILDYWIFAAIVFCGGGFLFGFFNIYTIAENPLICLLLGIGAFITGGLARFRPMIVGGLVGAAIGVAAFLFQGDLWVWQTLCIVLTSVSALIIPGHLYEKRVRHGV